MSNKKMMSVWYNYIVIPVTILAMGYYFFFYSPLPPAPVAPETFTVLEQAKVQKPLNNTINFMAAKRLQQPILTTIDTAWAHLTFSTHGGMLQAIDYKRIIDDKEQTIRTIFPPIDDQATNGCFMLALDDQTPFEYALIDTYASLDGTVVQYQATTSAATIIKTYTINVDTPTIQVRLKLTPHATAPVQPRLFFAPPYMPSLPHGDAVSIIVIDTKQSFTKKLLASFKELQGWFLPPLFGFDDRYFIHSMIADSNHFAKRAYYTINELDVKNTYAILEGPAVTESTQWDLAFYFGPKDIDNISRVDARLEQSLDYYGWFAPISKALLYMLKWLYQYLHNYGYAIIVLTLLMKLFLLPFSFHSEKKMRGQREMQKKLDYIEKKYKDSPERLAHERTEILKQHGMPMISGCLPMLLIQIPMFVALNRLLGSAIELYQAPMLWIPDLSLKDPYYILPVIIFVSMLGNGLLGDAKQRIPAIASALAIGALGANMSAGLALYVAVNLFTGAIQTYGIKLVSRSS